MAMALLTADPVCQIIAKYCTCQIIAKYCTYREIGAWVFNKHKQDKGSKATSSSTVPSLLS